MLRADHAGSYGRLVSMEQRGKENDAMPGLTGRGLSTNTKAKPQLT
jgi:hypothetical protein